MSPDHHMAELIEDDSVWKNITLTDLNARKARQFAPIVIVLAILLAIGFIGNVFVSYIYYFKFKRTSANYFIAWLAVLDLISCIFGIPFEIMDLLLPYDFRLHYACKIMRFSSSSTVIASGLTLVAVAFDRYYKIAQPLRRFPKGTAKILNLCSLVAGLVFALPAWFVFGCREIDVRVGNVTITAYECSVDETVHDTPLPIAYYCILTALFFLCVSSFVVLYGKLACKIMTRARTVIGECVNANRPYDRKKSVDSDGKEDELEDTPVYFASSSNQKQHNKSSGFEHGRYDVTQFSNSLNVCRKAENNDSMATGTQNNTSDTYICYDIDHYRTFSAHNFRGNVPAFDARQDDPHMLVYVSQNAGGNDRGPNDKHHDMHQTNRLGSLVIRTGRVTSIFICVSVVFVCSFLPYVIAKLLSKFSPRLTATVGYNIAARSFFLNSAANPLIYSFLNENFRTECWITLRVLSEYLQRCTSF